VTYFEPYVQIVGICNLRSGDIRAVHEAFEKHELERPNWFPYPMGVNVSKPFTVDHGNPIFLTSSWRFLAVMSIARADSC
jgi:hypothetical protein